MCILSRSPNTAAWFISRLFSSGKDFDSQSEVIEHVAPQHNEAIVAEIHRIALRYSECGGRDKKYRHVEIVISRRLSEVCGCEECREGINADKAAPAANGSVNPAISFPTVILSLFLRK